jgi:nucleoid-associated protein YgaU
MTDDANDNQPQPRGQRRALDEAASAAAARNWQGATVPPVAPPGSAADDDPSAALERLQALTSASTAPPDRGTSSAPPKARRSSGLAARTSRPRPAAAPRAGRVVARIVAPGVFLVAVVVLLSIVFQSGVIGGKAEPVVTPTPAATKTKSGVDPSQSGYKVYVVKSGDTLSGIAVKFGVSISEIEALNPRISSSTLVVGAKVKVPKPIP